MHQIFKLELVFVFMLLIQPRHCWSHTLTFAQIQERRCAQSWSKPSISGSKCLHKTWPLSPRSSRCFILPVYCTDPYLLYFVFYSGTGMSRLDSNSPVAGNDGIFSLSRIDDIEDDSVLRRGEPGKISRTFFNAPPLVIEQLCIGWLKASVCFASISTLFTF